MQGPPRRAAMIVRQGVNFVAHLLAGMLMGMLGVLAAGYLAKERRSAAAPKAPEPPPL